MARMKTWKQVIKWNEKLVWLRQTLKSELMRKDNVSEQQHIKKFYLVDFR